MPTSTAGFTGLERMEDEKDNLQLGLPDQNQLALQFYTERLNSARDQRWQARPEFDGMTYDADYIQNRRTADSYLYPKKNDDDVRVNTGTAEKRVEYLINELMSMNFQTEVQAFDQEDMQLRELGQDMQDAIKRTNEIERDEDFWQAFYMELLVQRAAFVVEDYCEPDWCSPVQTAKSKKVKIPKKRLLDGRQVFLGDMTIPAYRFQEQPYVVLYNRMLYEEARLIYGDSPQWKYVRPGMPMNDSYGLWFKYRFGNVRRNEVEIITYICPHDDEHQVIINSVMMEPEGATLPWEHGGYNMTMTTVKGMGELLAYGRSPLCSSKFLQLFADETFVQLIRKMRQAVNPPLGVKESGRIWSKDVFSPGKVTQGLDPESFGSLVNHTGVTSSEYQMLELITQKIEEFVGSSDLQNTPGSADMTATQVIELQKQAIKMLGMPIIAAMRAHRDTAYLRIWSILEKMTTPVGKKFDAVADKVVNAYQSFTIDNATYEDGTSGRKIIKFMDRKLTDFERKALYQHEKNMAAGGKPERIKVVEVKKLLNYPFVWYVDATPQERDSTNLKKVLFKDKIQQAAAITQLTGRQINGGKIIDEFERDWNTRDLFQVAPPQTPGMPQVPGQSPQPGQPTAPPTPGPEAQVGALLGQFGGSSSGSPAGASMVPKRPSPHPSLNAVLAQPA